MNWLTFVVIHYEKSKPGSSVVELFKLRNGLCARLRDFSLSLYHTCMLLPLFPCCKKTVGVCVFEFECRIFCGPFVIVSRECVVFSTSFRKVEHKLEMRSASQGTVFCMCAPVFDLCVISQKKEMNLEN